MIGAIHAALGTHLKAMQGLPPVAWENVKFDAPKDGSMYLREDFIPGGSDYGSLGESGTTHERGIYQVGISAPSGSGSGVVEDLADRIINHFKCQTLGVVRTQLPTRGQARPDEGRIWLAVSIPYLTELSRKE